MDLKERLAEHVEIKWVIQALVNESDPWAWAEPGTWQACSDVPGWLLNEDMVKEHFDGWVAARPDRQFRLHKTTIITRYEVWE